MPPTNTDDETRHTLMPWNDNVPQYLRPHKQELPRQLLLRQGLILCCFGSEAARQPADYPFAWLAELPAFTLRLVASQCMLDGGDIDFQPYMSALLPNVDLRPISPMLRRARFVCASPFHKFEL